MFSTVNFCTNTSRGVKKLIQFMQFMDFKSLTQNKYGER